LSVIEAGQVSFLKKGIHVRPVSLEIAQFLLEKSCLTTKSFIKEEIFICQPKIVFI